MAHGRIGHIRFPQPAPSLKRRNPATTGGFAKQDERVEAMLLYIENVKRESQLRALSANLSPDERAQSLGGYHDCLLLKEKFIELFVTPLTQVPVEPDEPEGEINAERAD